MKQTYICWSEIRRRINAGFKHKNVPVYGIPRGGASIAALLVEKQCWPVDDPYNAKIIVDDLIDSGRTITKWQEKFPQCGFFAPFDKRTEEDKALGWLIFPWESRDIQSDAEDTIVRLLEQIGEDPTREGLFDTPKRVVRSWKELFAGYGQDPALVLKTTFKKDGYDQMIILRDIEFNSFCEHHMLPFTGTATVAYIPGDRVVGLSKLARLVDCYAKRLQIQERLTQQVADSIQEILRPIGAGVIIQAKHHCMLCRGVGKQSSSMVTCALTGAFRDPEVRAEFLKLAKA